MHGSPSEPGNASGGHPAEDLDNVLSRFQEWSTTRNRPSAQESGSPPTKGRGIPGKKVNLTAGVRELSYEDALRATSYRRRGYQTPAQSASPLPPAANPAAQLPELNPVASAVKKTSSTPAAKASSSRPLKVANNTEPRAGRRSQIAASSGVETATAIVGATAAPQSEMPPCIASPSLSTERRKRARGSAMKSPALTSGRNRSGTETTQPKNPTPSRGSRIAQPAFREVLEHSAGLAPDVQGSAKLENKTIALSLRVSDVEQARIQACAARANVSVSAYLRQCALGVEELRDQVELALSQLRKQQIPSTAAPGFSAIPRILRDAAVGWFRRMRGNRDFTGISLR